MRTLRNDIRGYGSVSIALHWLGAAAVLSMLVTAAYAWMATDHAVYAERLHLHVSVGVLLYLIIAARILWHLVERRPQSLSADPVLRRAARTVHVALLALIAAQVSTGPLDVWSGGWPIGVFHWFALPSPFGTVKQPWHDAIGDVHRITGYAIALLVTLHVAAAAKHHLADGDGTLLRMLGRPRAPYPRPPYS